MFLPRSPAGNFGERVDDVRRYHLKSGHAQIVDDAVAFETTTWVP